MNTLLTLTAKTLRYIYDYNNDDFNGLRTPIREKNISSLVCSDDNDDIKAPITLYRIASERRDFCTGLGSCFHYATDYNPVRAAARKSLRFGGDCCGASEPEASERSRLAAA